MNKKNRWIEKVNAIVAGQVCVCVCVCVCVYGLTIWCYWVRHQGWPGSSLRMPIHPQVKWQATLMNLDGIQTLVVSRLTKLDSRRASERDLVLLGGNSGWWDLVNDQAGGGIAWEKGGDWIVSKQLGRHLFWHHLICFTSRETLWCL